MTLHKGDVVSLAPGSWLWRPITPPERAALVISTTYLGDDGEPSLGFSHISSQVDFFSTNFFVVSRARVQAPRGYGTIPKCVELVGHDGRTWWTERANVSEPSEDCAKDIRSGV